jgi:hypothetical protein
MAKTVTLAQLRTAVNDRGDYRDPFLPNTELDEYINDSIAILFGMLAESDPQRYMTSNDISVVSGTDAYNLPADFYKLVNVLVADSSSVTGYWPLERVDEMALHRDNAAIPVTEKRSARYRLRKDQIVIYPPPSWTDTVRIWYLPLPTKLTDPAHTFDSVNLWTEWVVLDVLVKVAQKARDEWKGWAEQRDRVARHILTRTEADQAHPLTCTDVEWGYAKRRGRPIVWRR